jgi:hypothetical protein
VAADKNGIAYAYKGGTNWQQAPVSRVAAVLGGDTAAPLPGATGTLSAATNPLSWDPAATVALLGQIASPGFIEQPTAIQMGASDFSPGNLLVCYRQTANGADNSGQGSIYGLVCTPAGKLVEGPFSIATDTTASNYDLRGPVLSRMALDGRLCLIYTSNPNNTGNPNGPQTGPDGITGSNRVQFIAAGADPAVSANWSAPATVPILTQGASSGFDSHGYQPLLEPSAGTVVLTVAWNTTVNTWSTTAPGQKVGYIVGTYAANGAITWNTPQALTTTAGVVATGEICLAVLPAVTGGAAYPAGSWFFLWRDSPTQTAWCAVLPGPVTINGSGAASGSSAMVVPSAALLSGVYANPRLTVTSTGKLIFPSRASSSAPSNSAASQLAWLAAGADPTVTANWNQADLDSRALAVNYDYGQVVELADQPGFYAVLYTTVIQSGPSEVCLRYAADNNGINPLGGVHWRSVVVADGDVTITNGSLVLPGKTRISATSNVRPPTSLAGAQQQSDLLVNRAWDGTAKTPILYGANQTGSKWQGLFLPDRPPIEIASEATGVLQSNLHRSQALADISGVYVSGTVYSFLFTPIAGQTFAHIQLQIGETTGSGITHMWGFCARTTTNNTVSVVGTDLGAQTLTAGQVVALPVASTTWTNDNQVYVGFCIVATTMPSIVGIASYVRANNRPPIYAGSGLTGQTTPIASSGATSSSSYTALGQIAKLELAA